MGPVLEDLFWLMRVALVTAIFGAYDTLKRLPEGHGFDDAVCVTDDPGMSAEGWRTIVEAPHNNPRLVAKRPKMKPNLFADADVFVWVDGQIKTQPGLRDFAVNNLGDAHLSAFAHPERNCLFDEAEVCKQRGLASADDVAKQVTHYRDLGMPNSFGLWECAVLVWSQAGLSVGEAWLKEVRRHMLRDQVSLPFVLWRDSVPVVTLPGRSRRNDYTVWTPHRRV